MDKILVVAFGGAIGAMLRYGVTEWCNGHISLAFPYGTVAVNLIGSFVIGFLFLLWSVHGDMPYLVKFFVVTGILGGFTTFSTYNMELVSFVRAAQFVPALAYLSANVIGGFIACWLGYIVGQVVW